MAGSNSNSTTDKIHLSRAQLVQLNDEFYQVFALNGFLYDAIEGIMAEMVSRFELPPHSLVGLGQVLSILKQRQQRLRERLIQMGG
ncbi:hypothetical protein QSV34_12940 [Porticoccus sp. W117]|uniref:hypothetical protein n=1 Tax=Porticoccus sp. W117 TaxID=3054777 RepID=UPI002597229C|nr:hypothetical protein [Porticoccus sp. W117]MDM3872248.1 hypothetical protein [Porticoccus sp. W117]MDM3872254.1 hypothetical protein [Porticoccus sp. W117]